MSVQILLAAELMSVLFLLVQIIATIFNGKEKTRSSKALCYVMGCTILSCLADSFCIAPYHTNVTPFVTHILAFISFSGGSVSLFVFIYYCYCYIRERTKINKWLFYVPMICTAAVFINILVYAILGKLYTIEGTEYTVTGSLSLSAIISPVILMIYLPVVAFTKRKQIGKRSILLLGVFGILPITTSMISMFTGSLDFSLVAGAIATSIVNLLQENKITREHTAALNKEILKKQKELENRLEIIQSMSKVYFASFYIDLVNDTYIELSSKDNIRDLVSTTGRAQENLNLACEKLMAPEFTDEMKEFFDLSTINDRLKDKGFVTHEYIGVTSGWSNALLIAGDRDVDGSLLHIFYACRTIHDEKALEEAQNKKIQDYNKIVTNAGLGIWYIYLKDGEKPRMKANEKMLQLLGIEDVNMSEEDVYSWWFDRISPEAIPSVLKSVGEMKDSHFSENTYSWKHPKNGNIYVRCGGTSELMEDGTYVLSGYHADVTHIVMQEALQRRTQELEEDQLRTNQMNLSLLGALGTVVEFRSLESGDHVKRVMTFTKILLEKLKENYPEYKLTENQIVQMARAAALHDVGKIAIPDEILKAPRKLTPEEFTEMKKHTSYGCEILEKFKFAENNDFYKYSYNICRWHHEKADGKGYPDGLKEDEIPIYCQVTAVADCFDALVSKRVYKDAKSCEESYSMIMNGECGVFSDNVLKCFEMAKSELFETVEAN